MKFYLSSSASAIALGAALLVAPAVLGDSAHAAAINGSGSIITFTVTPNGGIGDLLSATSFTFGTTVWASGAGDFSGLTTGAPLTTSSLVISNLGGFTFTSPNGDFTAASSLVIGANTYTSQIVSSSGSAASGSESLSIYLIGNFVPGGPLSGFGSNNASETISFTETGGTFVGDVFTPGSFSVSATFAAPAAAPPPPPPPPPPTPTPEPATMALLGAGLVGLGVARRRRG